MPAEDAGDSLFALNIDEVAQSHLLSTAKWNKFVAITGIAGCAMVILVVIGNILNIRFIVANIYPGNDPLEALFFAGFITMFFIPCIFQLRFADKMLKALANKDQHLLTESFKQAKNFSMYWGILALIVVVIFAVIFLTTLGASFSS